METIATLCITFIVLVLIFWMMPTKKMKAISKELQALSKVLPITRIFDSFKGNKGP